MKSRILIIMAAVFLALSGIAMAASIDVNTETQAVTVSECTKAGSYSFQLPDGARIKIRDQIRLNLTTGITLCKDIDIFLVVADASSIVNDIDNDDLPVYGSQSDDSIVILQGSDPVNLVANGTYWYGLHVTGKDGNSYATITAKFWDTATGELVSPADTEDGVNHYLQYNAGLTDRQSARLTIELFDADDTEPDGLENGTNNPGWIKESSDSDFENMYIDAIDEEDNVICINTLDTSSLESGQYVAANPQSDEHENAYGDDGFHHNFDGKTQIAQVSGSTTVSVGAIGKADCQEITINGGVDQQGNEQGDPLSFDPGDWQQYAGCEDGPWKDNNAALCTTKDYYGRGILIKSVSAFNSTERYRVAMTLVETAAGASSYATATNVGFELWGVHGTNVYWTDSAWAANNACDLTADEQPVQAGLGWGQLPDENERDLPQQDEDDVEVVNTQVSSWVSPPDDDNSYDGVMIDIGNVRMNPDGLSVGTEIGIIITYELFPCGTLVQDYVCLGTITDIDCSANCELAFPYGINPSNPLFWSGVVLTNGIEGENAITLTFTDAAGGKAVLTDTLSGNQIKIYAIDSAWFDALPSTSTLAADQAWSLSVTASGKTDGLVMIGGLTQSIVDAGIYGYSARQFGQCN